MRLTLNGWGGPALSACRGTLHCVLGQDSASFHPAEFNHVNGTGDKILGGNLRWTSIPSNGSSAIPSRLHAMETRISVHVSV